MSQLGMNIKLYYTFIANLSELHSLNKYIQILFDNKEQNLYIYMFLVKTHRNCIFMMIIPKVGLVFWQTMAHITLVAKWRSVASYKLLFFLVNAQTSLWKCLLVGVQLIAWQKYSSKGCYCHWTVSSWYSEDTLVIALSFHGSKIVILFFILKLCYAR